MKVQSVLFITGIIAALITWCYCTGSGRLFHEGLSVDHSTAMAGVVTDRSSRMLHTSDTPACRRSPSEVIVTMTYDLTYDPLTVTIMVGDRVTWVNTSPIGHTVTNDPKLAEYPENGLLPKGAKPFNSGTIEPGGTYTHTFSLPGTYRYFCIPHEKRDMVGEVIVRLRK